MVICFPEPGDRIEVCLAVPAVVDVPSQYGVGAGARRIVPARRPCDPRLSRAVKLDDPEHCGQFRAVGHPVPAYRPVIVAHNDNLPVLRDIRGPRRGKGTFFPHDPAVRVKPEKGPVRADDKRLPSGDYCGAPRHLILSQVDPLIVELETVLDPDAGQFDAGSGADRVGKLGIAARCGVEITIDERETVRRRRALSEHDTDRTPVTGDPDGRLPIIGPHIRPEK